MKHTQKVKLAKKMMTGKEVREGVSKFQSKAWKNRSEPIKKREAKKRK